MFDENGWCWNGGTREILSLGECHAGRVRCSRCGRMLKVRVPAEKHNGSATEATLPRHKAVAPTTESR